MAAPYSAQLGCQGVSVGVKQRLCNLEMATVAGSVQHIANLCTSVRARGK
jgi:hypothetical protein